MHQRKSSLGNRCLLSREGCLIPHEGEGWGPTQKNRLAGGMAGPEGADDSTFAGSVVQRPSTWPLVPCLSCPPDLNFPISGRLPVPRARAGCLLPLCTALIPCLWGEGGAPTQGPMEQRPRKEISTSARPPLRAQSRHAGDCQLSWVLVSHCCLHITAWCRLLTSPPCHGAPPPD